MPRLDHLRPDLLTSKARGVIEKAFGGADLISIGGSPLKSA